MHSRLEIPMGDYPQISRSSADCSVQLHPTLLALKFVYDL
jgi:hypothetical protein